MQSRRALGQVRARMCLQLENSPHKCSPPFRALTQSRTSATRACRSPRTWRRFTKSRAARRRSVSCTAAGKRHTRHPLGCGLRLVLRGLLQAQLRFFAPADRLPILCALPPVFVAPAAGDAFPRFKMLKYLISVLLRTV